MMPTNVKVIGITGGVGCGKTEVLTYIKEHYNCRVVLSDLVAKNIQEPGTKCYQQLIAVLGTDVVDEHGSIIKTKMAEAIFHNQATLKKINQILHPAVIQYIEEQIAREKERNEVDYFFVEAALLIENGFEDICDELWYVYAREEVRRDRLRASRGYDDDKITSIMQKQLSEMEFRMHCKVVIDNSGDFEKTKKQIDHALETCWKYTGGKNR